MITQALNKPTNCGTQMFLEENKCIKAKNIPQTVHNNLSTELQPNWRQLMSEWSDLDYQDSMSLFTRTQLSHYFFTSCCFARRTE